MDRYAERRSVQQRLAISWPERYLKLRAAAPSSPTSVLKPVKKNMAPTATLLMKNSGRSGPEVDPNPESEMQVQMCSNAGHSSRLP